MRGGADVETGCRQQGASAASCAPSDTSSSAPRPFETWAERARPRSSLEGGESRVWRSCFGWGADVLWQDTACVLLWALLAANVGGLAVEAVLVAVGIPGPAFQAWGDAGAGSWLGLAFMAPLNGRVAITVGVIVAHWLAKVGRISTRPRAGAALPATNASRRELWYSDWTAAASKDIFMETSRITKASQTLALLYCVLTAGLLCALALSSGALGFSPLAPHPQLSALWVDLLPHVLLPLNLFLLSGTLFVPLRLWSAAASEAVAVANDSRLWRILHAHWLVGLATAGTAAVLALHVRLRAAVPPPGRDEAAAYAVFAPTLLLYQVALAAWVLGIRRATFFNAGPQLAEAVGKLARRWQRRGADVARRVSKVVSSQPPRRKLAASRTNSLTEVTYVISTKEAGVVLRQKLNLTFMLLLMATGSYGRPPWATALLFLARVLAFLMLVVTRDEEVHHFTDLRSLGIGFGLVVNAAHLRAALRAYLRDNGATHRGPLHKHKASVYRMAHTLAVSYRWQATEQVICPGLCLNMSDWQLQSLLGALTDTGVLYVWIDRLSVPQNKKRSTTQKTLLARMMAVYASANATLCLRSIEQDGSRYHQRAWTLQEYCAANTVVVKTQVCSCAADINCMLCEGESAVADEEEQFFQQFRDEMLGRMDECRPSWLYGTVSAMMTEAQAVEVVNRFYALQHRVYCQQSVDKIRSLYPMLSNIPVENHSDLNRLVKMVSRVVIASTPLQRCTENRLEVGQVVQHQRKSMMCLMDEDGEQTTFGDVHPPATASLHQPPAGQEVSPALRILSASGKGWRFGGLFPLRETDSFSGSFRTVSGLPPTAESPKTDQPERSAGSFGSFRRPRFMQRGHVQPAPLTAPTASTCAEIHADNSIPSPSGEAVPSGAQVLMTRALTIRSGTSKSGTHSFPSAKRQPAEVRTMETLLAPSTEAGWLRRKSLVTLPGSRRGRLSSVGTTSSGDNASTDLISIGGSTFSETVE